MSGNQVVGRSKKLNILMKKQEGAELLGEDFKVTYILIKTDKKFCNL